MKRSGIVTRRGGGSARVGGESAQDGGTRGAKAAAGNAAARRLPGRPRSEVVHTAILDAAVELVREAGYDAFTIEGVAARAGVGKTTIYRRWTSKEALITEAVGRIVNEILIPDCGTIEGDLLALMRHAVRVYRTPENAQLMPGLVAAMARSTRIARAVRSGFLASRRRAIRDVLERAVARGELQPDMDRELALDMLAGPLFYRLLVTGGPIDERLARGVVNVMLHAFAQSST